jgi:hypothetical protein
MGLVQAFFAVLSFVAAPYGYGPEEVATFSVMPIASGIIGIIIVSCNFNLSQ